MKLEIKDRIVSIDLQIAKLKDHLSDQAPDPSIQLEICALEKTRASILREVELALINRLSFAAN